MKNYDFDVQFIVSIKAESYEQAVRIAAETFPDVNGKTMFIVDTETSETLSTWNYFEIVFIRNHALDQCIGRPSCRFDLFT